MSRGNGRGGATAAGAILAITGSRRAVAAVLLVAIVAVTGCGSGTSGSSQVASALKTYLSALANGNGSTACGQLTDTVAQQIIRAAASTGATTCPAAVRYVAGQLGGEGKQKLINAKVIDIRVSGDSADARIQSGTNTAQLSKIGGHWLISGLSNPDATTGTTSTATTSISPTAPSTRSSASGSEMLEAKTLNNLLETAGYHVSSVQVSTTGPGEPSANFQATLPGSPTVSVFVYSTAQAVQEGTAGLAQGQAAGRGAYKVEGNAVLLALGSGSRDAVDAAAKLVKGIA